MPIKVYLLVQSTLMSCSRPTAGSSRNDNIEYIMSPFPPALQQSSTMLQRQLIF